jgi:hypothetical protein
MTESERSRHLWDLAGRVAGTYRRDGVINRIGEKDLPSQAAIVRILQDLLAVVFPGYHGEPVPRDADLRLFAAAHLDRLEGALTAVLEQTLRFSRRHGCSCAALWADGDGDGSDAGADPGADTDRVEAEITCRRSAACSAWTWRRPTRAIRRRRATTRSCSATRAPSPSPCTGWRIRCTSWACRWCRAS